MKKERGKNEEEKCKSKSEDKIVDLVLSSWIGMDAFIIKRITTIRSDETENDEYKYVVKVFARKRRVHQLKLKLRILKTIM